MLGHIVLFELIKERRSHPWGRGKTTPPPRLAGTTWGKKKKKKKSEVPGLKAL